MWIPKSAEDVEPAISDGTLPQESADFDVKRDLGKTDDIAVDVAAMATAGGVLLYGVAEDKVQRVFRPNPIVLQGAAEKISNAVDSTVREALAISIRELASAYDATRGYLLVVVPASEQAPHMVERRGEYRYYGRHSGGNRLLRNSEVTELYARRAKAEEHARGALDEAITASGFTPSAMDGKVGALFVVVRPSLPDPQLRQSAWPNDEVAPIAQAIMTSIQAIGFNQPDYYCPRLGDVVDRSERALDGIVLRRTEGTRLEEESSLEVRDDGTVRFYRCGIAQMTPTMPAEFVIQEDIAARLIGQVVRFAGTFYEMGGYRSQVDVMIAVLRAVNAISARLAGAPSTQRKQPFPSDDYRRHHRVPAQLLSDDAVAVTRPLIEPVLRIVAPANAPDPLQTVS